jgi:hypothetical protein
MCSTQILLLIQVTLALGRATSSADRPEISPELKAFLGAEDLDDVGDTRDKIKVLSPKDSGAIRAILKEWKDSQAISNLLIHADLIPEDVRLDSLFRGLGEQRVPYYVLAAVLGFDHLNRDKLPAENRKRLIAKLVMILRETKDVRADRVSLTIGGFVAESDAPEMIDLMDHPNDTVRHNLRAWLFKTFKDRGAAKFAAAAGKSRLSQGAQRRLMTEFKEFVGSTEEAQDLKSGTLFAYIPNLKDFKPSIPQRTKPRD